MHDSSINKHLLPILIHVRYIYYIYLISMVNAAIDIPYVSMHQSNGNDIPSLLVRQCTHMFFFAPWLSSSLTRCSSSGSGRHFLSVEQGRCFSHLSIRRGLRRFGDLTRDLGGSKFKKKRDLQNLPTPTIKVTTFTPHHLRRFPTGKIRVFQGGENFMITWDA